jgi:hypothetical protein
MARRTRTSRTQGVPGGALTPAGTPYYIPSKPPRRRIEDMTPQEAVQHLDNLRTRLLAKQRRERAYLDRRAARGTHTPTDDAYEDDQVLEDELLEVIERLIEEAGK